LTLAPGTTATYTVIYTPRSAGTYNSSFILSSDGGTQTINLSATGVGLNPLNITSPGTASLPDANTSGLYTIQMLAAGGQTPFTWSAVGLPSALSINPSTGLISGSNPAAGNYTVVVTVSDGTSPTPVVASRSYILRVGSILISTTPLSTWTEGENYILSPSHTLTATGGTGSLSWMILAGSGTLPPGIVLDPGTGSFSGLPTGSGLYDFTVQATDSSTPIPQTAQSPYSITINPPPFILTTTLKSGVIGVQYTETLLVTGGTLPITWSVSGGLPTGLAFNTGTGVISGIPTNSVEEKPITVTAIDSTGATISKTLSISVNSTSGGGTGFSTVPNNSKSGCFIATAAYGSYLDPHVMVLRHFRDDVLLHSELGTAFVKFYYQYSPPIADFIAQHAALRILMRFALTPLIFAVKYPLGAALLFAIVCVWFIRRRLPIKEQTDMDHQIA
jgi:hypothetical protein